MPDACDRPGAARCRPRAERDPSENGSDGHMVKHAALALLLCCATLTRSWASDALADALPALASDDAAARKAAIAALGGSRDARALVALEDYASGNLYLWNGRVVAQPQAGGTTLVD